MVGIYKAYPVMLLNIHFVALHFVLNVLKKGNMFLHISVHML